MANNDRIVSTVLQVVESKESLDRAKADLKATEEIGIKQLISKHRKKKDKNEEGVEEDS